ncbi:unnamed protein product [Rotaria magnacalcarata]|uniref:Uncharacterized protein n=1 Tax=Rotaria magnacalcarata TaxID=392030 RepID=A0A8S2QBX8_9BILA|nr:unnamed protein product [Rotaria magnacalcarata]
MEEEDDVPAELPPKLVDAMEMVRRLHLLATTEQPQLHCIISQLDSQLTQLFIDSKQLKHKTIEDFSKQLKHKTIEDFLKRSKLVVN